MTTPGYDKSDPRYNIPSCILEGSMFRAMAKLQAGAHPEDVMIWLVERLDGYIECCMGDDQPNYAIKDVDVSKLGRTYGI